MAQHMLREVIKKTAKCPYNFACLKDEPYSGYPLHKARYVDGGNLLFIDGARASTCPHQIACGNGFICSCSVHYSLFCQGALAVKSSSPT